MAIVRKCSKCGMHADIKGSSNKRDAFGRACFICANCVKKEENFPEGNLSPLLERPERKR